MSFDAILQTLKSRFWVLILVPLVAAGTALYLSLSKPVVYSANARLLIDYRTPMEGELAGQLLPVGLQDSYVATQLGIMKSRKVAEQVAELLGLADYSSWQEAYREEPEDRRSFGSWAAGVLLGQLTVTIGKDSRLVDIWYTDYDPAFAAQAANAFAEAYRDTNKELGHTPAMQSAQSVEPLLVELRAQLEEAERNLSDYQQRTGIVATNDQLDVETAHLTELADHRLVAEAKEREAASRLAALKQTGKAGKTSDALPELLRNDLIQQMQIQIVRLEAELADKSLTLGQRHPDRRRLAADLASVRESLAQATAKIKEGISLELLEAQEIVERARSAEEAQKEKVLGLRHTRDGLQPLRREVESASESYDRALRMYSEYAAHGQLNRTNITLLDPAEPPWLPSSPDAAVSFVSAVLGGLLLAIGLILGWEAIDPRIRARGDVRKSDEELYLGELPRA